MPFPPQTPIPFTRAGVEALKPRQIGCYGLFLDDRCIYVGKGDLRARLLGHLNGDNPCITRHAPTHFMGLMTPEQDLSEMYVEEQRLIEELAPVCNRSAA